MNIKQLVEQRLRALDPTIDLSASSPAQALVVDPIVRALSPDALTADVPELLKAKLLEEYPDVTLGPGDAFTDLLINACSLFMEPYRQVLSQIAAAQNLSDPDTLAVDDIDALASNWLVARRSGRRATGNASVTLTTPRAVQITSASRFLTNGGLVFIPRANFTISAAEALRGLNAAGQYVVNVPLMSESLGNMYNIPVGAIQSATGIGSYAGVTNTAEFTGGADIESSAAFLNTRLPQVIHERSLVTEGGVIANVLSDVSNVESVEVAGFGDVEMTRDIASVEHSYTHIAAGVAVLGKGFALVSARHSFALSVGDTLQGQSADGVLRTARVVGVYSGPAQSVLVRGYTGFVARIDRAFDPLVFAYVSVLREGVVVIGGEEVASTTHLGGRVDVYLNPVSDSVENSSVTLTPIGGVAGVGCEVAGRKITLTDLAGRARRGQFVIFYDDDIFKAAQITGVDNDDVYVDTDLSGVAVPPTARWRIVDHVDTHLTAEPNIITETLAGTVVGSRIVTTPAADLLYVRSGDELTFNELGTTHEIVAVGAEHVELAQPPGASGLFNGVVTRSRSGVSLPLTNVVDVDVTGEKLPYGPCVGVSVLTASDVREIRTGVECRLTPKLTALYPDGLSSLKLSSSEYEVAFPWVPLTQQQTIGRAPYRFGTAFPVGGSGVVTVQSMRATGNIVAAPLTEIELPLDMFTPGAYNVLVAYGDLDVDKVIAAASAYYTRAANAVELLEAAIPTNMLPPAPAFSGDVVHAFGGEWVVDREYPIEIVFSEGAVSFTQNDTQRVTALDYTRVLRLSVLRLHELLPPPLLSEGEADMERVDAVDIPGVLALPDFLRALLQPAALMTGGAADDSVAQLVTGEGFVAGNTGHLPLLSRADVSLFTLIRPATGTARMFFESPQEVELRAPFFNKYTHSEALSRMATGAQRSGARFFRAEDIRLRSEHGAVYGGSDPRAWPRGADLRSVQRDVQLDATYSQAAFVAEYDEHDGLMDFVQIDTEGTPTCVLVDPEQGDELAVLQRSFSIEAKPPTSVPIYFRLTSTLNGNDSTLEEVIADGSVYNFFTTEDGNVAPRALVDRALRVDGVGVESFLSEALALAPGAPVNTTQLRDIDHLGSREIFYTIVPSTITTSRPYVSSAARANRLGLVKLYESQVFALRAGMTRDLARVLTSADAVGVSDTIRDVNMSDSSISVDREMSASTATIYARGWGRVFKDKPDELVIEGAMIGQYAQRTVPIISDNFSGIGAGGTTRLLAASDAGAYITLVNTTWHPSVDGSPEHGVKQIDHGTYKISSVTVESGFDTPLSLSRAYRSTAKLSDPLSFSELPAVAQHMDVFFLLTDKVAVPQNELKACKSLDIYAREPLRLKINAVSRIEDGGVFVSTLDDESASSVGVGPLQLAVLGGDAYNPTLCDALPFAILRPGALRVTADQRVAGLYYADIPYASVSAAGVSAGESRISEGPVDHDGFGLIADGQTFSMRETPRVTFKPVLWRAGTRVERMPDSIGVKYTRALPVSDAHLQFASPRNRVLCSDLLSRRMIPARVGVFMRYSGGSEARVVREDVRAYIEGQARSRSPIDVSDLVGLVYRRGVDRVISPTHVLVYVEDLDRQRHVLVVTERFDIDTDVFYTGTARVTSARAPESNGLGITLDIERV